MRAHLRTISSTVRASLPRIALVLLALAAGAVLVAFWHTLGFPFRALVDCALLALIGWLFWDRATLHDRGDQAIDVADQALSGLEDVKNHLFGLEPESAGKHSKRRAA